MIAAISPRGRRPRAARLTRSGYALPPQARDMSFLILIVAEQRLRRWSPRSELCQRRGRVGHNGTSTRDVPGLQKGDHPEMLAVRP